MHFDNRFIIHIIIFQEKLSNICSLQLLKSYVFWTDNDFTDKSINQENNLQTNQ